MEGRSYWIYDKNGTEWEFSLTESNGHMEIKEFSDTTNSYDKRWAIRFGNYIEEYNTLGQIGDRVSQMCYIEINSCKIVCYLTMNDKTNETWVRLCITNPLIFKTFPKSDDVKGNQYMVYDLHNKSDRLRLKMTRKLDRPVITGQILYFVNIFVEKLSLPDIPFIRDMNDSLFKQIDSMIDYHTESGLSGHMLWFNIKDRHYYCFQPEGQQISDQVFFIKLIAIRISYIHYVFNSVFVQRETENGF